MTELDEIFVPEALALLDEFGKAISYIHRTRGAKNLSTGKSSGTTSKHSVKAYPEEYSPRELVAGTGESKASGILAGDKKLYIAAASFVGYADPTKDDAVEIASATDRFTVMEVNRVWSGEEVALYILQVRRA